MRRRATWVAMAATMAVGASLLGLVACDPPPPTCDHVGQTRTTVRYQTTPGVTANLQSLDVYRPKVDAACPATPVLVYVHGGGWMRGDKANSILYKVDQFAQQQGWLFVSVNYRLSPSPPNLTSTSAVRAPTHARDVAAAIGWVHRNAAAYGADPSQIAIMGHSAGASLVATVATDESLLAGAGVPRSDVGCVSVLDTRAYDIAAVASENEVMYENAFGTDRTRWPAFSPQLQVTDGEALPDVQVIAHQGKAWEAANRSFVETLVDAGGTATMKVVPLDHEGINDAVGNPSDTLVTPALLSFLEGCYA